MLNSTAPQDAPLTLLLILGQDIKSDGFSIETCKIMVDMLDVSFNRPRGQRLGECETALWEDSNTCFLPLTAASGPRRPSVGLLSAVTSLAGEIREASNEGMRDATFTPALSPPTTRTTG